MNLSKEVLIAVIIVLGFNAIIYQVCRSQKYADCIRYAVQDKEVCK